MNLKEGYDVLDASETQNVYQNAPARIKRVTGKVDPDNRAAMDHTSFDNGERGGSDGGFVRRNNVNERI